MRLSKQEQQEERARRSPYQGRREQVRFADADELREMRKLAAARTHGGSLNQFILHLLRKEMEKA